MRSQTKTFNFTDRHIGPSLQEQEEMLKSVNASSLDDLINKTVPASIRSSLPTSFPAPMEEHDFQKFMTKMIKKNKVTECYIGLGYHPCFTPPVIQRNVFENPGWYTQYTPYQPEISQGRLEALFYFQTLICELTGLPISNASLLDEGTAAAEAMTLTYRARKNKNANTFFISDTCLPQTINVIETRAEPLEIKVKVAPISEIQNTQNIFGVLVQYPNANGLIEDISHLTNSIDKENTQIIAAVDLLSLTMLTPPGEWGADIVVGCAQRFGVPMGYGGPHAGFIASKEPYKRLLPGRIIGLSKDKHGQPAYRMALQTREQHIRREKATSNICTAQALLAIMATFYAIYHGPKNLLAIASKIHSYTCQLNDALTQLGYNQKNKAFFDTLLIECGTQKEAIMNQCEKEKITVRNDVKNHIGVSLNELSNTDRINELVQIFAQVKNKTAPSLSQEPGSSIPSSLNRTTPFLQQQIFNQYHTETELMRLIKTLENKDLSLTQSMIPLGSCTMKLNAAIEMMFLSNAELASIHPFAPLSHTLGYQEMFKDLEEKLSQITGFDSCSLQPNSGAQGEYAGLLAMRAYHADRGDHQRNIMLIPSSAHGTNPASAVMAGYKTVIVKCDESGNIDCEDLKAKAEKHSNELAGLMITYPSTHGVFEEQVQYICNLTHEHGGQVYMDGANMNAQVGLTSPGKIGADCCHLNLHKTFSIPHGGGGPGVGPICVAKHLTPYLPAITLNQENSKNIGFISAAPWGSASILSISYAYIKLLGNSGLLKSTEVAILNANYIKSKLEPYYPILYTGKNNTVAHELIIDIRPFRKSAGIEVEDIAKRLMDYSFHSPTMSWPVPHTMMIEPTESENKAEMDRFCDAMIGIYHEIKEIESHKNKDNVLKNAPHIVTELVDDNWQHAYSRKKASYPIQNLLNRKVWPTVGRVDQAYGDRNLVCTCSIEDFIEESELVTS